MSTNGQTSMTVLAPMRPETYASYLEAAIAGYAADNVAAGRWPETGASERSRTEFAALLPLGLSTPDNYLYEIHGREGGPRVGFVWLAIERKPSAVSGFVYDLEINHEYRRQGHGSGALTELEVIARAHGATSLGLHVFAFNEGAQALYRRLGYQIASLNLRKKL